METEELCNLKNGSEKKHENGYVRQLIKSSVESTGELTELHEH